MSHICICSFVRTYSPFLRLFFYSRALFVEPSRNRGTVLRKIWESCCDFRLHAWFHGVFQGWHRLAGRIAGPKGSQWDHTKPRHGKCAIVVLCWFIDIILCNFTTTTEKCIRRKLAQLLPAWLATPECRIYVEWQLSIQGLLYIFRLVNLRIQLKVSSTTS